MQIFILDENIQVQNEKFKHIFCEWKYMSQLEKFNIQIPF
jgi:hypothetical protein